MTTQIKQEEQAAKIIKNADLSYDGTNPGDCVDFEIQEEDTIRFWDDQDSCSIPLSQLNKLEEASKDHESFWMALSQIERNTQ